MLAESYRSGQPLAVFGLLPHEQKMSVVHFLVKRFRGDDDEPVQSKEQLTFHVGYRRFAACPIYSQHTNMNKHKVMCCITSRPLCSAIAAVISMLRWSRADMPGCSV